MNRRATQLSITALTLIAGAALAGPLNPPAGPVAPTMKTLGEVEPRLPVNATNTPGDATCQFKIGQPGSYYLTGDVNLVGFLNKHGIVIAASNVTLDLNGFNIVGPGMSGSSSGIVNGTVVSGVTIRDGRITNWPGAGLDLQNGSAANNCTVDGVLAVGNQGRGIQAGNAGRVRNCTAQGNLGPGISLSARCVAQASQACNNGASGFEVGDGSTLSDCVAAANVTGFAEQAGPAHYEGCTASHNSESGFTSDHGCVYMACIASENGASGIVAGTGSVVRNCLCQSNLLDGITAFGNGCLIQDNNCTGNGLSAVQGGAGVHINPSIHSCRVDGNTFSMGRTGLWIEGVSNFVSRNTSRWNTTNYQIAAGNTFGPIVAAGTSAAQVNGSSAPGTLGSSDPWANFSH